MSIATSVAFFAACASQRAVAQMGPTAVELAPVERRSTIDARQLVASVEPVTRTTLAAEREGLIAKRHFDEGQTVKAGQLLAEIDTTLLTAERDSAAAKLNAMQSVLVQSQAESKNATAESKRVLALSNGILTEKETRDVETMALVAQSRVSQRQAELEESNAEIRRLDILLAKSKVVSPIEGVIARRRVEVGQWVEQGAPVAELVQINPLHVLVRVPESAIGQIKPGDGAEVRIDAIGSAPLVAKVDSVMPEADIASRTFIVKLLLDNPSGTVRPGFFATATLKPSSPAAELTVPKDAVLSSSNASRVVAFRAGKAVVVPVNILGTDGPRYVVTGDLTDTDQVVIRGNESLMGGEDLMPTQLRNAGPAATPPAAQPTTAPSTTAPAGK